jgi:hypothetical protein
VVEFRVSFIILRGNFVMRQNVMASFEIPSDIFFNSSSNDTSRADDLGFAVGCYGYHHSPSGEITGTSQSPPCIAHSASKGEIKNEQVTCCSLAAHRSVNALLFAW